MIKSLYRPKITHNWQKTERQIGGGYIIKFFACTEHMPAHLQAYDLIRGVVSSK